MSSTAAPFGLRPAWHPSGIIRPVQGTLVSALAVNIFQDSPVALDDNGFIEPREPNASATVGRIIGSFQGVEFTDVEGRRQVSNRWVANTVATEIVVYYTSDPWLVYEMQGNAPVTQALIGDTLQYTALAGNTTTGLSSVALDVTTGTTPATDALRVVGVNPAPDNVVGDAFTIAQVIIQKHQFNQSSLLNPAAA